MSQLLVGFVYVLGTLSTWQVPPDSQIQVGVKLTLGKPKQVGSLAVVPIVSTEALCPDKYITLSQAIKRNLVQIIEIPGRETVNSLEVKNLADLPLLLFAGELLLGGKQDRIVAKDSIVPPRESRHVPVFCVEHGRWSGTRISFDASDTFVNDEVRFSAYQTGSQAEVWSKVAESNAKAGVVSSAGTIQAILNDPKRAESIEKAANSLKEGFKGVTNAIGVICWLNGKVLSADLFANAELFEASRDKLLRSYAIDAHLIPDAKNMPVDMKACNAFLTAIIEAKRELEAGGIHGTTCKIRDGKIVGYEYGKAGFGGGLAGGGFGHGTYKPAGG